VDPATRDSVDPVDVPGGWPVEVARDAAGRDQAALTGRYTECAVLDQLVKAVGIAGESRALVVHGEMGVGKTALLDYLAGHAPGCRVARAAGVQSEMELPFAGLHQLCAPLLDRLETPSQPTPSQPTPSQPTPSQPTLPLPQRDALRTAFGLSAGPPPDRFLLGLAVLSLLSHVAEDQPLVCLIDDEQWIDQCSSQVLAFVARRLGAESVGLVFAARVPSPDLAGLPELVVRGLPEPDARALLDSVLTGSIDPRVRDQIVAETRGNPLALLELPRELTLPDLAGGFGLPGAIGATGTTGAVRLAGNVEESFRRRVAALPDPARRLLLLAAADPTGDPALVWRAAGLLAISADAAAPAIDADLAEFGTRVRFRHPLARSTAYRLAPVRERQQAHRALAEATDPRLDPDRRAWHRAQAAAGPDEEVAAELEHCAERARARGGLTAAAAFLKQAATLTLDPALRAGRALAAAQVKMQAGVFDVARDLLDMAETGPLSDVQQASAATLRARLAFITSRGGDAPALLLKAAHRLEPIDPAKARAAYLDAISAAIFTGRLASPGSGVLEVARAAAAAPPPPRPPRAPDFLLDGLTAHYNEGYAAGVAMLRRALAAFGDGMSAEEELHWLWLASVAAAIRVWDDDRWDALSARHVQLAREHGALGELPLALTSRAYLLMFSGDLAAAAELTDEVQAVKEATGGGLAPYGALGLAALRGEETTARSLIDATRQDVTRRGEGVGLTFADWASAVLGNGLGDYGQAAAAAQRACAYADDLGSLVWTTVELIEASVRTGLAEAAASAYEQLGEMTEASDTDWAVGIRARSAALLAGGDAAERLYRESIARLGKTRLRVDLARAHLLYGEWLRRERRRLDAREHLRVAHGLLAAMGVAAFADRAWRELRATGATSTGSTASQRPAHTGPGELTAQEAQIARLARDGLSNPEIGTRLFISAHTVQYHLRKVFAKLGISSRSQLDRVLPANLESRR
jgi:DNA-binding CsgD family transcriptional regulator